MRAGLVKSLSHPGGNLTGIAEYSSSWAQSGWELLRDLVPDAKMFGLLVNPHNPNTAAQVKDAGDAARATGMQVIVVNASSQTELDAAFARLHEQRAAGLIVGGDPAFYTWRDQLLGLAARDALPTIYYLREFALAGGLISYGTRLSDISRQIGLYAGKILAGAKPADLRYSSRPSSSW